MTREAENSTRCLAVSRPRPELPPVITYVFPEQVDSSASIGSLLYCSAVNLSITIFTGL